MRVLLGAKQKTALFQIADNRFARRVAVHAGICRVVLSDMCIRRHHVQNRQIVAQSHLKVIRVMRRRDLHASGSEILFHVIIGNHGDFSPNQRQNQRFSDHTGIALISRVDCHCRVAEQGFRSCGCHLQVSGAVLERVADMPKMPGLILILHLGVGNGCQALGAPVDDAVSAVDQPLIIQPDKDLLNSAGAPFVHGEALSVPVARRTHFFELGHNPIAVLLLPRPGAAQKFLSADFLFCDALFAHCLHDLCLGCD
ncbi:uncharacterized protein BN660_01088 [Clostridium sp. CAG:448]|nr:uncharacterized protein BN660_01088 [Clostridium sp. CAG:448]